METTDESKEKRSEDADHGEAEGSGMSEDGKADVTATGERIVKPREWF